MRSQGRRIGCGDNREVDVLGDVVSDSVYALVVGHPEAIQMVELMRQRERIAQE